ncbi:MAG: hypothetical protein ACXADY_21380 [Candidatus Hodarchaeales archaeon]|jgi:hypothetical protein
MTDLHGRFDELLKDIERYFEESDLVSANNHLGEFIKLCEVYGEIDNLERGMEFLKRHFDEIHLQPRTT